MSDRNWLNVVQARRPWRQPPEPTPFSTGIGRQFGNLEVRPKLVLLHNLFFLTLALSVYFAVIPAFERRVQQARAVEIRLLAELFSSDRRIPELTERSLAEGSAADLRLDAQLRREL
ncbi:MAG TPA: hypothetical protein VES20_16275, partial [Bryobacteraceae bacterium]|nr:hypothetical protein [Bryobacteraceae bacterium]